MNVNTFNIGVSNITGNGSITSATISKQGNVIVLRIGISTSTSTSAGSNIVTGDISDFLPTMEVTGVGYALGIPYAGSLNQSGRITIRALGTVGGGSNIGISFSYVCN